MSKKLKIKINKICNKVYGKGVQNAVTVSYGALMNGPLLPYKKDIPFVEGLRAYINMIKCENIYRQYNFADMPLIDQKTKTFADPFIINFLKWSPSRDLVFDLQKRQRELRKRKVYQDKKDANVQKGLYNIFTYCGNANQKDDFFLNYLRPFEKVVEKFKISRKLDEVVRHIENELVLKPLQQTELTSRKVIENKKNFRKTRVYYKNLNI